MEENFKNKIINFAESFSKNIGKRISFQEAICTNKDSFDRHFTTFSRNEFILRNFSIRMSGARFMFDGENLKYEIGMDHLIQLDEYENEVIFIEAYSENILRKTILKIIDYR